MTQDAKVITIITKNNVFELDNRSFRKLKPIIRNDFGLINIEIRKLGVNRYTNETFIKK